MQSLSLGELNGFVRKALELTLPDLFWVRAELSEVRHNARGHYYLQLVEHAEDGAIVAEAKANIWNATAVRLVPKFEIETGQRLKEGLKVLMQVRVTFHEVYGYSLNVTDIDANYTLGDAARRRQEIIRQLQEDGVFDMNRELALPRPVRRIAVISSATAAGFGDFENQLHGSGHPFVTKLFPAVMQGENVESSIIEALEGIHGELDNWDCVAIIRGGGATTDLNGFESYLLAAHVAQFPLPVLTGIGHERDDTIVDAVAHTRLKTPTAVAAFLTELWESEEALVDSLENRLKTAVASYVNTAANKLQQIDYQINTSSARYLGKAHERLALFKTSFQTQTQRYLTRMSHSLEITEKCLAMSDPQHVLKLGYSITRLDGKAIRTAKEAKKGDVLETTLADGKITSKIQ